MTMTMTMAMTMTLRPESSRTRTRESSGVLAFRSRHDQRSEAAQLSSTPSSFYPTCSLTVTHILSLLPLCGALLFFFNQLN